MEVPGYVLHLGCGRRGRKAGEVEAGTVLLGLGVKPGCRAWESIQGWEGGASLSL